MSSYDTPVWSNICGEWISFKKADEALLPLINAAATVGVGVSVGAGVAPLLDPALVKAASVGGAKAGGRAGVAALGAIAMESVVLAVLLPLLMVVWMGTKSLNPDKYL